jgi:DNA-directed RNA polymerase specialized sigma24 family protein
VARSILGSRDEAEDCAATAIVQLYERAPAEIENLEAYLVTATKRRACDVLRNLERERRPHERLVGQAIRPEPDVADVVVGQAEAAWLDREAVQLLRPATYEVLSRVANGKPIADVAHELGLTKRAAESHLLRARKIMRHSIARGAVILGGLWAGLRRGLPAQALVVVPAACLAIAVAIAPGPGALNTAPSTLSHEADRPLVRHAQGAAPTRSWASRVFPDARAPSAAGLTRHEKPIASVQAAPGLTTSVARGETGEHESGPIEVLEHCLRDFRIDPNQIGCAGP